MSGDHHDEKKFRKNPKTMGKSLHGPYWMRAHRDWRFLAVVFVMLAAILTYLFTSDLSWLPHTRHLLPAVPAIPGN
jgi:hypothetical protein